MTWLAYVSIFILNSLHPLLFCFVSLCFCRCNRALRGSTLQLIVVGVFEGADQSQLEAHLVKGTFVFVVFQDVF